MPRVSHEQKQFYKTKIRSLLAIDHSVSHLELQRRLDADSLHLDREYLTKLVKEINHERMLRADRKMLSTALSTFEDAMTETMRIAWEIALDPFARRFDRLLAIKEIREAHNDVFDKLFDAGVFDRKHGSLDLVIRNTPLPAEKKEAIRNTFTNWGLLPAPQEDVQPAEPTTNP